MAKKFTTKNSATKSAVSRAEAGFAPKPQTPDTNSIQVSDILEDWGFLQMKNSNNAHVIMSA